MTNPQQPELRRSGLGSTVDESAKTNVDERPHDDGATGPIPEKSSAGHHPSEEQDQPDLDAFAERLGVRPEEPGPTT